MGWVNGMMTGGDFKISLQETRSQFYFGLAYLMAVNIVRDRKQLEIMLWVTALCIGLKGILYTFRRYVTLHGLPLPDQGVGSHEEAFFFDAFIALLLALTICGAFPNCAGIMWPCCRLSCWEASPATAARERRLLSSLSRFLIDGCLPGAPGAATADRDAVVPLALWPSPATTPRSSTATAFWRSLPAPSNRSFEPDARDASSNAYRDAENADLMATIHLAPIQGYGYGKRMLHAVPIADISSEYEWWDIMTHNQVLWVWMRVGNLRLSRLLDDDLRDFHLPPAASCGTRTRDLEIKVRRHRRLLIVGRADDLRPAGLAVLQFPRHAFCGPMDGHHRRAARHDRRLKDGYPARERREVAAMSRSRLVARNVLVTLATQLISWALALRSRCICRKLCRGCRAGQAGICRLVRDHLRRLRAAGHLDRFWSKRSPVTGSAPANCCVAALLLRLPLGLLMSALAVAGAALLHYSGLIQLLSRWPPPAWYWTR